MSIIKVNTLKHTNDTEALTVASDGKVSLAKPFSPNNLVEYWLLNKGNDDAEGTSFTLTPWALDTRTGIASRNTGMSHSTGVFTFPRTGLYRVSLTTRHYAATAYIGGCIDLSTDTGANYTTMSRTYGATAHAGHHHFSYTSMIFNIANATTYKMRFVVLTSSSVNVRGNNDANACSVLFEEI